MPASSTPCSLSTRQAEGRKRVSPTEKGILFRGLSPVGGMKAPVYVGEIASKHRAGQVLAPPIPAQVGWEAGWEGAWF